VLVSVLPFSVMFDMGIAGAVRRILPFQGALECLPPFRNSKAIERVVVSNMS